VRCSAIGSRGLCPGFVLVAGVGFRGVLFGVVVDGIVMTTDLDPAVQVPAFGGNAEEALAFSVGVQAYIWGYPLAISAATALLATHTDRPLPNGHAPFNSFGHVSRLFTAANRDVVSSNVDTVYSSAFLDLQGAAVVVSVPAMPGRYYSLMLEDAYTNVFGYVGSRATGAGAGRYLIAGPGWQGEPPEGIAGVIVAPTALVWIIGRTLVDNEQDLPAVRTAQAGYGIEVLASSPTAEPIAARWGLELAPGLAPVEQVAALDWSSYFHWVGQLMRDNPPPDTDQALVAQFARIGISVEHGFVPSELSDAAIRGLQQAHTAGALVLQHEARNTGAERVNGWAYNLNQGLWGLDFPLRGAIALRSLGQNTAVEALYFNTREDSHGEPLDGSKEYRLTFAPGLQPPVDAFWSITMYDAQDFLVDNPIDRYSIGNRTPDLHSEPDGTLTIHVQHQAPDATSNWLPAPEGPFRMSLRLYNPRPQVLTGEWTPPAVHTSQ